MKTGKHLTRRITQFMINHAPNGKVLTSISQFGLELLQLGGERLLPSIHVENKHENRDPYNRISRYQPRHR
jgi:hypothetical protein